METTANSTARRAAGAIPTAFFLALIITAMVAAAWFVDPGLNWILVAALMILFVAVLGVATNGRAAGILINEQKLMSLSRFQMVLWTIIIISGYFVIAISRIGEVANPLLVAIDPNVWILLGISATSLVGTPMLLSNKKQKEPADKTKAFSAANKAFGDTEGAIDANRVGVLYGNADVSEARFTDIFEGDEVANTSFIDVAKVQMFFFTAIVAIVYSAELLHLIMATDLAVDNVSLPLIDEGLVTLMGISNAGYLGGKMITQTPATT